MPSWNADQYLRFAAERTRPCRDLVAAINLETPQRIIDLGCGPGNSTSVLAQRWSEAEIVGLDSSDAMIETARKDAPERAFVVGDIESWSSEDPFDLVFSNASLHWVENHKALYPRLLSFVAAGGAMAAQVPCNMNSPAHEIMRETARRPEFQAFLADGVRQWQVHEPAFYYDVLAPHVSHVDIWTTEYMHILSNAAAIVEWYKGTGLRPFLDRLPDASMRTRFVEVYEEGIIRAYPARPDGRVILPFQRLFVVAYRSK
jgi:trans-aconitate 2-methyltransferase